MQYNVDAIHPGFGFLSERADFAKAVSDSGIIWIGPSPVAIEMMGDKMTARKTMKAANVPVIPGEEIDFEDEEKMITAIRQASERVGYPLLLKASSGGGGKGNAQSRGSRPIGRSNQRRQTRSNCRIRRW